MDLKKTLFLTGLVLALTLIAAPATQAQCYGTSFGTSFYGGSSYYGGGYGGGFSIGYGNGYSNGYYGGGYSSCGGYSAPVYSPPVYRRAPRYLPRRAYGRRYRGCR